MAYSRVSRIEERRTRIRLFLVLGGIVALLLLLITVGIPIFINASVFVGNLKTRQPLPNTGDKTPPFPPTLASVLSATNSATLKVEGFGEPESTLKLFLNDEEVKKILLGNDGTFSFSDITLKQGTNIIYGTMTDASGNESTKSDELKITYKQGAPKLEITEPTDGQSYDHDHQDIVIKGTTDPGNELRINNRFVPVKDDGSFIFTFRLADGENTLTCIITDPAGNTTQVERKVTYNP